MNYRKVLIDFIKKQLNGIDVYDGAMTFKQPKVDYVTYYVLNEDVKSVNNNTSLYFNSLDPLNLVEDYKPLTVVVVSIDIRGTASFKNTRDLLNSFDIINNKLILQSNGFSLMNVGNSSSLPILKNTRQEEGYIFELTFSYSNEFSNVIPLGITSTLKEAVLH